MWTQGRRAEAIKTCQQAAREGSLGPGMLLAVAVPLLAQMVVEGRSAEERGHELKQVRYPLVSPTPRTVPDSGLLSVNDQPSDCSFLILSLRECSCRPLLTDLRPWQRSLEPCHSVWDSCQCLLEFDTGRDLHC